LLSKSTKAKMSKTDKKIVPERVKIPAYGDERIEEAKGILEQVRRRTEEKIVKIKVNTELADKDRRTTEERNKKERANKIQNEVI